MPNKDQLRLLKNDVTAWNNWRKEHPNVEINLRDADLERSNLAYADLRNADLRWAILGASILTRVNFESANLSYADLAESDLRWAKLKRAHLEKADIFASDLTKANLRYASLSEVNLSYSWLCNADLRGADLTGASLVSTDLSGANISDCIVYGISAWDVELKDTIQKNLAITPFEEEPVITVDELEVAQFIYLLLNNKKIKNVIETISSKTVLILGRFTDERKEVLEAIREKLRQENYLPILFDFEKPASRDLTETITLLARMSRFVIADLSDPKSLPQELTSIIPDLPSIPIQPIIVNDQREYAMYEHWQSYPWVLDIHRYKSISKLIKDLKKKIITPSELWIEERKKTKRS